TATSTTRWRSRATAWSRVSGTCAPPRTPTSAAWTSAGGACSKSAPPAASSASRWSGAAPRSSRSTCRPSTPPTSSPPRTPTRPRRVRDHREHVRKLTNGFWLCHRALASRARVVYGSVYAIPGQIGPVDVATFGCVLLHLRDPLLALTQALRLTSGTAIVTEPVVVRSRLKRALLRRLGPALLLFPRPGKPNPETTWWVLTPELVQALLGLLGFEDTQVTYHTQAYRGRPVKLFTVVGQRTRALG